MKQHLTKLTAAGLAVLALTGCTGGAQETAPSPQSAETTWTLTVGQPEDSTCWAAAEAFAARWNLWSRPWLGSRTFIWTAV